MYELNFFELVLELPLAERFMFIFNTALTEISHNFLFLRKKILNAQLKFAKDLIDNINRLISFKENLERESLINLCNVRVPLLIGFLRSFGR